MSTLQRSPVQPAATAPPAADAVGINVVIRWEISADALRTCALPQIVAMNGQAARINGGRLEWTISRTTAAAHLILDIGDDDLSLPLIQACPVRHYADAAATLDHLEVPGQLIACIDRRQDAGPVVYARTPVLERLLGLPGGVYDTPCVPASPMAGSATSPFDDATLAHRS